MTRHTHAVAMPLLALAAIGFLATAPTAAAIYVVTPLNLDASATQADVGDTLTFRLSSNPEHEGSSYAGQTVRVQYGYDTAENAEPSGDPNETTSSSDETTEETPYVYHDITTLTLDDAANGSFEWIVPAEVDDHNVFVTVLSDTNETLASAHIGIGDADPMMFLMRESGPASPPVEGEDQPLQSEDGGSGEPATDAQHDDGAAAGDDVQNPVPALGVTAAAVAMGVGALLLARRR